MNDLRGLYKKKKKEIESRLKEFSKIGKSKQDMFYELCFCILAAQTNAVKSWKATEVLRKKDFLNSRLRSKELKKILKECGVRFHNNKASYLIKAKSKFDKIIFKVKNEKNSYLLREWLVKNVKGLGMKEASHFLRNSGRVGIAIIDRHILKNMIEYGIVEKLPKGITKKIYLDLEKRFLFMAKEINIRPEELDLLLWAKEVGFVFR